MSNFIKEFKKGQSGGNKGVPMGVGLENLSRAINGTQRGMTYGVAAAPKCGKSTFVDYAFVFNAYLYSLQSGVKVIWTYFSFEMDRVTKEFDFASFFMYHDYNIKTVKLPEGVTVNGESTIPISSAFLRGRIQDDNNNIVKVPPEIEECLKNVYLNRIVPLFGEYDSNGIKIKDGVIDFIEQKENPTGLRNKLLDKASQYGQLIYQKFVDKMGIEGKKLVGYLPNDPNLIHIVITDTIRKIPKERGFSTKETVDKYLEYCTEIRNMCSFTFVHIVHLNRSMSDTQRMKFLGDILYPTPEDIKDTGNLSEECDHLITLFNPNDERYNLKKHFGKVIKDAKGNELYPNMRTAHLVESRHSPFPQHFGLEMEGNIKNFNKLIIK